ncbi:MAG: hypothetical protein ACIWVG_06610 [Gloeotrichia echinulata HAB0833]
MQVYKLKAKINESGNLIIDETLNIPPGEVEVMIFQPVTSEEIGTINQTQPLAKQKRVVECSIPILKEWLESTEAPPADFDPDQAKWEYLKEKHNL